MDPFPIITNERLLLSALRRYPQYTRGSVCSCGKVLAPVSMAGHVGGSNRKWTIKAGFKGKHHVVGYTLMEDE